MRRLVLAAAGLLFLSACGEERERSDRDGADEGGGAGAGGAADGGGEGGIAPSACSEQQLDCDEAVAGCETNILEDAEHCGGCGHVCEPGPNGAPACVAANCAFACDDAFADCNGLSTDGCETTTLDDVWNCGACGNACATDDPWATPVCDEGVCASVCFDGFADCNGDPDDGCETAIGYDTDNCGACGNVCVGEGGVEECNLGRCSVRLADIGATAADLQVHGASLYASSYGVVRVPLAGGEPSFLAFTSVWSSELAVAGSEAYFAEDAFNSHRLLAVPLTGGGVRVVSDLGESGFASVRELVLADGFAFWTDLTQVSTVSLAGGTPAVLASGNGGAYVAGDDLYWTSGTALLSRPVAGGSTTTLLTGGGALYDVAVAGGYAYVLRDDGVARVLLSGGPLEILASGLEPPQKLVADGANVYFTTRSTGSNDGALLKLAAASGALEQLATLQSSFYGALAVDATHVYWADDSYLYKTAK